MKGHEEIEQILASYRDATPEERARADAHVAGCASCAARRVAFDDVDARFGALAQPVLPARLRRPLAAVLAPLEGRPAAPSATGFVFTRTLVPTAVMILAIVALSVVLWAREPGRSPVTSTPTLTSTLTPTLVSARETEPAVLAGPAHASLIAPHLAPPAGPTPAPAPAPSSGKGRILLAGFGAHATMTH